jgi:hypothetical protein
MRPRSSLRRDAGIACAVVGLAAVLSVLVSHVTLARDSGAIPYLNPRYGFTLMVPDALGPVPTRLREEGGLWESDDGQARLLAVAMPNRSGETLASYRAFVLQRSYSGAALDYAPVRATWFVLSGVKDGIMFYERINLVCEGRYIYGWQMTYPAAESHRWDRVVEAVHRSYRPGRGEDGHCGASARVPG